jgi:hypothetical protein
MLGKTITMFRSGMLVIAALLAVAAIAPSVASATELHGAPTMRVVDSSRVQLTFSVDKKLARKDGRITTKITVAGKPVKQLAYHGRHGTDFVYTATVARDGLQTGTKYAVVFRFPSGTVTRQVKVHPES